MDRLGCVKANSCCVCASSAEACAVCIAKDRSDRR